MTPSDQGMTAIQQYAPVWNFLDMDFVVLLPNAISLDMLFIKEDQLVVVVTLSQSMYSQSAASV